MQKVIWTWWYKGRENAPEVVRRCISSWEQRNPGWQVRCLDGRTASLYLDLAFLDLKKARMTAESLSDVVRIQLLHEYGGVWADPSLFCHVPLDTWLPAISSTGFFAFSSSATDRVLESWFLAADGSNDLVSKWAARAVVYWRGRTETSDRFWLDHLFGDLCSTDMEAQATWARVPRLSDEGPFSIQAAGPYKPVSTGARSVDWTSPVFKLPRKLKREAFESGCLLDNLLSPIEEQWQPRPAAVRSAPEAVCGLKVTSENVGDHIQIFAANRLLRRIGLVPTLHVDRDHEIGTAASLHDVPSGTPILLNGWFKKNPAEWPPHPKLAPAYLGFHVRLSRAPFLVSEAAIAHYKAHGPIGCRDVYTHQLLTSHGVEAFLSNCLSLSLPRRFEEPSQTEVFVVSRDKAILDCLPDIGPFTFLSHYTGSLDFDANMTHAIELLDVYRHRAKLIVTTLLHCALPAIALGIPVIVFYPPNDERQHRSDCERFSSLQRMIRIYHLNEALDVDWNGRVLDVSATKLAIIDALHCLVSKWNLPALPRLGPLAPPSGVRAPSAASVDHLANIKRFDAFAGVAAPDRERWGNPRSYKPEWADRAKLASSLIRDGKSIFEIGVGDGTFGRLVKHRCPYEGADLAPLDVAVLPLDIERDPLPARTYDYVVALGVIEYLSVASLAIGKMCAAGRNVLISYCCRYPDQVEAFTMQRRQRGWVNDFSEPELDALFVTRGFRPIERKVFQTTIEFEQTILIYSATG